MTTERPITRARQAVGLHAVTVDYAVSALDLRAGDTLLVEEGRAPRPGDIVLTDAERIVRWAPGQPEPFGVVVELLRDGGTLGDSNIPLVRRRVFHRGRER